MKRQELTISGMSCNHCVMAVKKELGKVAGVTVESVEIGKAKILCDESSMNESLLGQAIEEAGYKIIAQMPVPDSK